MSTAQRKSVAYGISGFSAYTPPYRVDLEKWCDWTGNSWGKVNKIVGSGFRMLGEHQSPYTMAATAAMRLIERYDIDPQRVGYLALATESSSDNAIGSVIVKGMLDRALIAKGRAPLSRECEVPEIKQACLAGVYALKAAVRYLALDGEGRVAIIISTDTAEYERGSTGEQTQGAGAVAQLIEANPKMLEVDLRHCGSSSAYRGPDFRKPFQRFLEPGYAKGTDRLHDFPVFNGLYSTACYIDQVVVACKQMMRKLQGDPRVHMQEAAAVFMHRPYHRIPRMAWSLAFFACMAESTSEEHRKEITSYCTEAGVDFDTFRAELQDSPDLFATALKGELATESYPAAMALFRWFRSSATYRELVEAKMSWGADVTRELGNLYSASLPAWLAAGLEDAAKSDDDLVGKSVYAVGYGSGDAAEAMPMTLAPGWREAAKRIGFADDMQSAVDLNQQQYEALHDGGVPVDLQEHVSNEFVVDHIGDRTDPKFTDKGIEYYAWVGE